MKGFYKNDNNNNLLYAQNFVCSPTFEIFADQKDKYQYPVEGWYWFETDTEAYTFFNITPPTITIDK